MIDWDGLRCWEKMSPEVRAELIITGRFHGYGRWDDPKRCDRIATVAIEGRGDRAPGPRYYCLSCALAHLARLDTEENN